MSSTLIVILIVAAVVLVAALVTGVVLSRRRRISLTETKPEIDKPKGYQAGSGISLAPGGSKAPPHPVADRTEVDGQPGVGDDASVPRDSPQRGIVDVTLPDIPTQGTGESVIPEQGGPVDVTDLAPEPVIPEQSVGPVETDEIAPTAGRLERLRGRLSRSRSTLGQGLLGLLGAGDLDEDSWTEVEDTLLLADLGAATTQEIVDRLRAELVARGVRTSADARTVLRSVLIEALHPEMDRAVRALPHGVEGERQPAVVLVAGVNGTGKTTTTGKLARVLVADGHSVVLGAADTFRAAAADQLQTWAERVGAETVRGKEGADPAAVAFDAVRRGRESGVDAVLIDTAGRLHTKTGLMDELGKVKRVIEKQTPVDEVLLVLDATTGQNGLTQARVFGEVVDVTGIVLTKLDGTAKGGIVFQVQRELGVPVKLVGLGEGADDLAPFDPAAFVDALLG
ncbi:Signal recognition particle receptor protein FtsY (=alpha subunit) (TC 3.A.5.1.1) [Alloactinosynnema sp. L-07]|uniref:signal recognition particle-docking protein FtsY n=1 Tax=Alloactinosynnema sp. L-07 TaxID=1653480 RepID=UPI00065EF737|nr:signal recognition particle-docking protein FtsY [Alloactinosynnema sp. L-07]CRK58645.1 Signal recognition particle receptor protein FtsY (=alpha subunit) (TC 3.A.5.1.1) [Alloactinosynnema sp. L-07]